MFRGGIKKEKLVENQSCQPPFSLNETKPKRRTPADRISDLLADLVNYIISHNINNHYFLL